MPLVQIDGDPRVGSQSDCERSAPQHLQKWITAATLQAALHDDNLFSLHLLCAGSVWFVCPRPFCLLRASFRWRMPRHSVWILHRKLNKNVLFIIDFGSVLCLCWDTATRQKVLPVWNSLLCWERWRCVIISVLAAFSVIFTIQLCVTGKKYAWINFEIWVLASGLGRGAKKKTYFLEQILWRVNWRNRAQVLTSGFNVYSRCELQRHLSTTRSPWGKKNKKLLRLWNICSTKTPQTYLEENKCVWRNGSAEIAPRLRQPTCYFQPRGCSCTWQRLWSRN